MKYDFMTIGGATEDISLYTDEGVLLDNKKDILRQKLWAFEYGAKIKIEKSITTYGGGAINAAVAFSRMGFRAASLIAVGADERGRRIITNLKKEKIDARFAQSSGSCETGFSFILVGPKSEHIVFSNRGANKELKIGPRELAALKQSNWIYIASLSGKWQENLAKIFSLKNLKFAWNPGHIQLKQGYRALGKYLKLTDVLIVNKDEAIELALSDGKNKKHSMDYLNNTGNLLDLLKNFGPRLVVITEGAQGAYAFDGKKKFHVKAHPVKIRKNTTGVGDAFGSSFAAGLTLYSHDIRKALELAARNSAAVVEHLGAQTGLIRTRNFKCK